jgi:hypothetical protein
MLSITTLIGSKVSEFGQRPEPMRGRAAYQLVGRAVARTGTGLPGGCGSFLNPADSVMWKPRTPIARWPVRQPSDSTITPVPSMMPGVS